MLKLDITMKNEKLNLDKILLGKCDSCYHDIIYIHGENLNRKQIKNLTTFLNKLGLKIRKTHISFSRGNQ